VPMLSMPRICISNSLETMSVVSLLYKLINIPSM
jgi:hypothetical protein